MRHTCTIDVARSVRLCEGTNPPFDDLLASSLIISYFVALGEVMSSCYYRHDLDATLDSVPRRQLQLLKICMLQES
jgi:hypothetical protein